MELLVDVIETMEAFLPFAFNLRTFLLSSPALVGLYYLTSALGLHLGRYWLFLACFAAGYAFAVAVNILGVLWMDGAPIVFPLQERVRWRVHEDIWPPCSSAIERFRLLKCRKRELCRRKRELLKHFDSSWRAGNLKAELAGACSMCARYVHVPRHTMLEYQEYNQKAVRCWLRLYPRGRRVVAIATDLTGRLHYGASITNSIEIVAFEICLQFRIAPRDLVLVEHYDRRDESGSSGFGRAPEHFDMVELEWDRRGKEFRKPLWHRVSLTTVERMTGCSPLGDWCTELVKAD